MNLVSSLMTPLVIQIADWCVLKCFWNQISKLFLGERKNWMHRKMEWNWNLNWYPNVMKNYVTLCVCLGNKSILLEKMKKKRRKTVDQVNQSGGTWLGNKHVCSDDQTAPTLIDYHHLSYQFFYEIVHWKQHICKFFFL